MVEIFNKGVSGDAQISPTELGQFKRIMMALLYNGEDTFRMYQAGLLNDDVFDGLCSQLKISTAQSGWRAMWKQLRLTKGREFREFVDQFITETPVAAPADELADWKLALAAERIRAPN
jgi:hypothetical protein